MADFEFNCSKGRLVELANRVNNNDPTNAAFVLVAINTSATDATLKDLDTLAAIESDANTAEATNSGYARKTITSVTVTLDDSGDEHELDIADQTWSSVAATGGAWTDLVLCYDSDTTGGTDANIVPCLLFDFAVTPDGSDITAQVDAAGIYAAS